MGDANCRQSLGVLHLRIRVDLIALHGQVLEDGHHAHGTGEIAQEILETRSPAPRCGRVPQRTQLRVRDRLLVGHVDLADDAAAVPGSFVSIGYIR